MNRQNKKDFLKKNLKKAEFGLLIDFIDRDLNNEMVIKEINTDLRILEHNIKTLKKLKREIKK